ncbi:MAG: 6-phosphogluconolactonase [Spongiibacteraceae bacterium]
MITEHFFDDKKSMFAALLEECKTLLHKAINENGQATLLVSGGGTPKPLYQALSRLDIDWEKVTVALVDERWVDSDHPSSNEALIKNNFLQNKAVAASLIGMKTTDVSAADGQQRCEQAYQQLNKPFDLTILGMGPDGHTASLFPLSKGLHSALDEKNINLCTAITATASEVTGVLTERMSLTLNGLLQSKQLHLLITGEDKLAVYKNALLKPDAMLMPISAVLHQQKIPVVVYWAP